MHQSSIDKMQSFKDKYLEDKLSEKLVILDLGSQNIGGSYRHIFDLPEWKYFGLDIEAGENVDIVIDNPYEWNGIQSDSVDVLISGQALEHIEYFWLTILEIVRVLKPGGLCCLVAPSSGYEHRYPVDCWRFYSDGMRSIAQFAKLEVIETFTQWEDRDYTDGSNVWHDSVLIASKPVNNEELIAQSSFNERYADLLTERGQTELYRLQLQRSQNDVIEIQTKLYQAQYYTQQAQSELDHTKSQLQQAQSELDHTKSQLQRSRQCIKKMENSKFWKLRNAWFEIKKINRKSDQLINFNWGNEESINFNWEDDLHLKVDDVSFYLSYDTNYLITALSSEDCFLLAKPRHMVERVIAIAQDEQVNKIFEMGILQGGSTVLYDCIIHPQIIVAIDHDPAPVKVLTEYIVKHERSNVVKPYYGINQADRLAMEGILHSAFPHKDIDLIIDDASHLYEETRSAFNICFPYLRSGGIYIIEDWAWAHWSGDYWQNGENPGLAGKDAMSNLLIELFMLTASRPDFIKDILIEHSTITIRRGNGALPDGPFNIADHYLLRGKKFGVWL